MFNQEQPGKLFPNMSCSSETPATGRAFKHKPLSSRFQQESVKDTLHIWTRERQSYIPTAGRKRDQRFTSQCRHEQGSIMFRRNNLDGDNPTLT